LHTVSADTTDGCNLFRPLVPRPARSSRTTAYVGTTLTPLSIQNPVPACALNEIAAIGIHVTFLAGPQIPTEGYAADEPTTLDTIGLPAWLVDSRDLHDHDHLDARGVPGVRR